MKRNRKASLSGTSTGDNNNTPNVNKKQRVLFTSCRRPGLTRNSSKAANKSLSQTSTSDSKEFTKPKSLELIEKLSVFDFPDSPRSSPQHPKKHDVSESNTDIEVELCSFIDEPVRGKLTETTNIKPKKGISNKAIEPVQLSIDHEKTHNLSPCVLLCKLDLNKIKISSPYTISDSEESEKSKSPNKIKLNRKKTIGKKIELLNKSSNDVESEISQNTDVQFNKLSKKNENISKMKHENSSLTPKVQASLNKIDDFSANETENVQNSQLSNDCVKNDDEIYYSPIIKRRNSKISLSLKNKAADLQKNENDLISSSLSNRLNAHSKYSWNIKNDEGIRELDADKITKPQNIISTSGSDSDEPLIKTSKKLKCTKLGDLKSKVLEKQETPASLKTENLEPCTSLNLVKETNAPDTILPNPTSSKKKNSTKLTSSESRHSTQTQRIDATLQPDEASLQFISEPEHLELAKPEFRPTVKSKGSRKHYHDMPQVLPVLNSGYSDPEKFGWEKHESLANTNIKKNQDVNITAVSVNETPKSLSSSKAENSEWEKRESTKYKIKELQINLTPISIKDIHTIHNTSTITSPKYEHSGSEKQECDPILKPKINTKHSQSQDSDKETIELNITAKHKKSTKSTSEAQCSVWEKFKTEAKRKQDKDASSLKHNTSTKPDIQHSGWEKHVTPVSLKPKQIKKHAFQSEDWNKELQELDMQMQSKINLKRKTKLTHEFQQSDVIMEIKEPNTNIQTNKETASSKHKKTKIISESQSSTKESLKIDIQLNKKSESTKPKESTEIPSSEFQYAKGEFAKNILSLVNPANLNDTEYIKEADHEASILDKEKSTNLKLFSIASHESVKEPRVPVTLPSTNDNMKQLKLNSELQHSFKETENLDKCHSFESKDSVETSVPLLEGVQKNQNIKIKKQKKVTSQHFLKKPQNSDKNLHLTDTNLSDSLGFKHRKSTTLFPSAGAQDTMKDLLELDVNTQSNSIVSDDESINSELDFLNKNKSPKLEKSVLTKKSMFTTAIQRIRKTDGFRKQRLQSNDTSDNSLMHQDLFNKDSNHTDKRKRSTSAKHKKHIAKPGPSNRSDYSEKSSQSLDYSDSEDDFMEKPRRRKSSMSSNKTDDKTKAKKLITPVVDALNKTEHIRIRENISYTIIHKGTVISYVKSHDNDVEMKTTESDDNQQAPALIKMCTKLPESQKSMIIERRNYSSTNTCLSISDKENSENDDTECETSSFKNQVLEDKKTDKIQEPVTEQIRKTNNENKELTNRNEIIEEKKIEKLQAKVAKNLNISNSTEMLEAKKMGQKNELTVENVRKLNKKQEMIAKNVNIINANISVLSTEMLEGKEIDQMNDVEKYIKKLKKINKKEAIVKNQNIITENISTLNMEKDKKQESVVEKNQKNISFENKNIQNEKIALRNAIFEARTKNKNLEPVIEKTVNYETEMNEKEISAIRNELLEAIKHKKQEAFIESIHPSENKINEIEKLTTIKNEKEITKNIEQEKMNIRNELSEVRKEKRKNLISDLKKNKKQEIVAEKIQYNLSSEHIEQENLNIRNELLEVRMDERKELISELKKNKKQEVVAEKIQKNLSSENIEQEKLNIKNELLEVRKDTRKELISDLKKNKKQEVVAEKIEMDLSSENIEQDKLNIRNELLEVRKKDEINPPVNEMIQKNNKSEDIEHEKSIIRNELLEARKKDKRRMSEKIRKHKAKQQVKEASIIQTNPTNDNIASTSNTVPNMAIESQMNVEQIKQEINATEAQLKARQEILDRLKRLQVYKKAHDLQELRKITLQIKSGCREALIDLLLVLKEHSNSHIDMGTLLHNMKITNDLVGYNEEEDIFV